MNEPLSKIFAYVFPLSKELIDRILYDNKRTLTKFLHRQRMGSRFHSGMKILFYETGGPKQILAEANVLDATMMLYDNVHKIYGESVILTKQELLKYVDRYPGRINKPLLILTIDTPNSFLLPIKWEKPMTMIGRILSSDEYKRLVKISKQK